MAGVQNLLWRRLSVLSVLPCPQTSTVRHLQQPKPKWADFKARRRAMNSIMCIDYGMREGDAG